MGVFASSTSFHRCSSFPSLLPFFFMPRYDLHYHCLKGLLSVGGPLPLPPGTSSNGSPLAVLTLSPLLLQGTSTVGGYVLPLSHGTSSEGGGSVPHGTSSEGGGSALPLAQCTSSEGGSALPQKKHYIGVKKLGERWRAQIRRGKAKIPLGSFDTEDEAGMAYDEATISFRGSKAILNFTPLAKRARNVAEIQEPDVRQLNDPEIIKLLQWYTTVKPPCEGQTDDKYKYKYKLQYLILPFEEGKNVNVSYENRGFADFIFHEDYEEEGVEIMKRFGNELASSNFDISVYRYSFFLNLCRIVRLMRCYTYATLPETKARDWMLTLKSGEDSGVELTKIKELVGTAWLQCLARDWKKSKSAAASEETYREKAKWHREKPFGMMAKRNALLELLSRKKISQPSLWKSYPSTSKTGRTTKMRRYMIFSLNLRLLISTTLPF
ncbi:hypothetical protein NE237_007487 [Protea cynaroides]|uniref:AP2/ERF domain-containing protein n=1 Tax=Protea cynaroides TaxID=273540 RepID=A0A9Q0KP86_9MAGN|nr:hypothetical protein NE237_007487 [Protea cynaroides]